MKVKLHSPIAGLAGSHAGTDLIFQHHKNRTFARAGTAPFNPKSPDQEAIRDIIRISSREWEKLTEVQRLQWEQYHATHYPDVRTNGISMFNKASICLGILGLAPSHPAPVEEPPPAVIRLELLPFTDASQLGIVVVHAIADPAEYALIIRATPPMPSVARKPRLCEFRLVNGVGPASTHALPPSGESVTIALNRKPVPAGKRFGIELQIVRTTDGVAGKTTTGDFIR